MSLKDIVLAGVAYTAFKQSRPPGVLAPAGHTVTGIKHIGLGSTWKVSYIRNEFPNITDSFEITGSANSYMTGADKWEINWP